LSNQLTIASMQQRGPSKHIKITSSVVCVPLIKNGQSNCGTSSQTKQSSPSISYAHPELTRQNLHTINYTAKGMTGTNIHSPHQARERSYTKTQQAGPRGDQGVQMRGIVVHPSTTIEIAGSMCLQQEPIEPQAHLIYFLNIVSSQL